MNGSRGLESRLAVPDLQCLSLLFVVKAKLVELLVVSNYWIGPFQGVVSGAIGYLFISEEDGSDRPGNRGNGKDD